MGDITHKIGLVFQISVILFLSLLLSGCKPIPEEDVVRNLISMNFESRHFKVTELKIADIKPSSGQKIYMSSETYIVTIPLITLEATQDIGNPVRYKKGQRLRFPNVSMGIKEDLYQKGKWIITDMRGISVP